MVRIQAGIATAIWRATVREAAASRGILVPIKGPLKPLEDHRTMVSMGLREPSWREAEPCRLLIETILGWVGMHWENYVSISFHIEWDMIVVTVFLSILNQMEIHLVQNRKEICYHDHIPFNVKGNGNIVFLVRQKFCYVLKHWRIETYSLLSYQIDTFFRSYFWWHNNKLFLRQNSKVSID